MLTYLDVMHLYPQEVFCVGRGSKITALSKMLDEWPDRQIIFFDDSMRHINDACSINNERLTVVHVEWPTCEVEADDLRYRVIMSDRDERQAMLHALMAFPDPKRLRDQYLQQWAPPELIDEDRP
jgi:hypothetical protein